jgi:hypothetical protein
VYPSPYQNLPHSDKHLNSERIFPSDGQRYTPQFITALTVQIGIIKIAVKKLFEFLRPGDEIEGRENSV